MIHYNWTEQRPTYLIWGLLLTTIINIMIWNETFLINTYIFGGCGWRWWQDIDDPILPYLTIDVIFHIWQPMTYSHILQMRTFIMMYRTHCQRILDTVISANFEEVWLLWVIIFFIFLTKLYSRKVLGSFYLLFFEILLIHVTYI